ncbi:MAG: FCD domain-containing protein [Thermomicrobiales bacterium]
MFRFWRGTFVAELTERDVRDISTCACCSKALPSVSSQAHGSRSLRQLEDETDRLGACARRGDHIGIVDHDIAIHRLICGAPDNAKLLAVWESLVAPVRALLLVKYRITDDSDEIERGHRGLIEAIRARDPDLAEDRLKSHIVDTAELVLRIREQEEPDTGTANGEG